MYVDVCVCAHVYKCPRRPGEGVSVPGAGVSDTCEPLSVVLGTDNVGPLPVQQAFLTMDSTFLVPPYLTLRLKLLNKITYSKFTQML